MSVHAYRWARKQSGLSSAEKFVLVMLGEYYNESWHRAWPSPARLVEETALSLSTVKRSLRSLESRGLIASERWVLNDGAENLPNRYLFPVYAPDWARPAGIQPVLVFVRGMDDLWADDDEFAAVPGSNLIVELADLDADRQAGEGRW